MGILKVTSRFGLLLGFIALLCTAVSAGIYMLTKIKLMKPWLNNKSVIASSHPQAYFNNNLLESVEIPEQDKLKGIQKSILRSKIMC